MSPNIIISASLCTFQSLNSLQPLYLFCFILTLVIFVWIARKWHRYSLNITQHTILGLFNPAYLLRSIPCDKNELLQIICYYLKLDPTLCFSPCVSPLMSVFHYFGWMTHSDVSFWLIGLQFLLQPWVSISLMLISAVESKMRTVFL